jgi:hypothetical protein
MILTKARNKTRMPTFPIPIQYSFGIPSQDNKTRAGNERDLNKEGRRETIPICRLYDPISLKDLKNATKLQNHKLFCQSCRIQS